MSFLNFDSEPAFDTSEFLATPEEPMLFDFDYTHRATTLPPRTFHGSDRLYDDAMNNINTSGSSWSPIPSPSSSSSPIAIPSGPQSPSFFAFSGDHSALANPFSPTPSPRPSPPRLALPLLLLDQPPSLSVSPHDTQTPAWATQLWDHASSPSPGPSSPPAAQPERPVRNAQPHASSPRSSARHSPLRPIPRKTQLGPPVPVRERARERARDEQHGHGPEWERTGHEHDPRVQPPRESFSAAPPASAAPSTEEREATVRARRRSSTRAEEPEFEQDGVTRDTSPPLKSVLGRRSSRPAWQLYFTDWIQRQQANSSRKLNVAQAAKEAGQSMPPYKRRSQAAKDVRERQLASYMRTLTPDDIKRENAFRAAQRKAGKSRKSNIKDPNAPKKPLSAYFMFLQRIRADKRLVEEVFGEETETTRQSPFLAQAEQEKMEYEAARRVYEDGAAPAGILPGVGVGFPAIKIESSESEGEGDGKFLPPATARS
ncbi:putative HMG1 protein [Mycena olivaceomarginata]|nr:putative HMG1 protein [Mycena olivaceomarginata]